MNPTPGLKNLEAWHPGLLVVLFIGASLLMLWRPEQMTGRGVNGTVLGTLVMPYYSGIGILISGPCWIKQNA
jgi:cation:H+ antiporter